MKKKCEVAGVSKMTRGEREDLQKLIRKRERIAKADAASRGREILAIVESQLCARFSAEDEVWRSIVATAEEAVEKADAEIAALCRERGVPESFRPSFNCYWESRGENGVNSRRTELRKLAQAQVEAQVSRLCCEIERDSERMLTQLLVEDCSRKSQKTI